MIRLLTSIMRDSDSVDFEIVQLGAFVDKVKGSD